MSIRYTILFIILLHSTNQLASSLLFFLYYLLIYDYIIASIPLYIPFIIFFTHSSYLSYQLLLISSRIFGFILELIVSRTITIVLYQKE